MVPDVSRRQVLLSGGVTATALLGGYALAENSTAATAELDGWPMVRHDPGGRSYAPEADPPTEDVTVRWRESFDANLSFAYAVPPVVAAGRVYVGGHEVVALDADTGAVQTRIDRNTQNALAVAPAQAYDSPTLVHNGAGGVTGLHASGGIDLPGGGGQERWTVEGSTERAGFGPEPVRTPPVAVDGTAVVPRQGSVVAIDASDGDIQWRREADGARPAVVDGTVFVTRYPDGIVGFDLETGERRVEAAAEELLGRTVTAGEDQLVVATREGVVGLSFDGSVRWRYQPENVTRTGGAVALAEGTAYTGASGEDREWLVAVDTADGTEQWRRELPPAPEPRFAPPAVANDTVYVPTGDQEAVVALDAEDGGLRWRFVSEGEQALSMSPVALAGETLYVSDSEYVYALEEP